MIAANVATGMYFTKVSPGSSQMRKSWGYFGATLVSWFAGKLSYRDICITKIAMSTSNSPMARKFRERKGMNLEISENYVPPNEDPFYQELPADPVDPWGSSFSSSDPTSPRSGDAASSSFLDPAPPKESSVTYDSLRESNRRSYQDFQPVRRQF